MKELKRLKYRFVIIVMAMLFTVTGTVFAGIYYTMARAESWQAVRMMQDLAERDGGAPRLPRQESNGFEPKSIREIPSMPNDATHRFSGFQDGTPTEFAMFRNSFSIRLDMDGDILSLNSAGGFFQRAGAADLMDSLSASEQTELTGTVSHILARKRESGTLVMGGTNYRFLIADKPYGQIIVLLDRSLEIATQHRLLSTLLVTGGIGLILLFLVSLFLAERAITPMRKAWERQKRFIADASHELKTPLTVIAANTDVVMGNLEETVASQSKWLGYIRLETDRMSKLVNDLLKIAKLDATESKPVVQPFNLTETVAAACLPLESLAFESGRALVADLQPNLAYEGDADSLQQVVGILIDNAIRHASGDGDIHVSLSQEKESGKITLTVRNPGKGIPDDKAERIFERFYRLDASRTRDTGGYGLGLAIAKTVVEQHGGTISVTGGSGTQISFVIILPNRKKRPVRERKGQTSNEA